MNGKRMYELLEKLNFVRVSGTDAEREAAQILARECASFGLDAQIETFTTQDGEVISTEFEVLAPYKKTYQALGFKRGASVDTEADVEYAENALEVNLADVRGKILIINESIGKTKYEPLHKSGAACVVVGCGSARERAEDIDLQHNMFRTKQTEKFDTRLAALTVRASDLYEMIEKGASRARVKIEARDFEGESQNVVARIQGVKHPEQVIVFTAHYDSVEYSHGIYDNAAGCAILMELARYYTQNPPARTLLFIWTGSEERGLLGSKAYVSAHESELDNIRLCINCDLAGSVAGYEFAIVTGPESLKSHIDMLMKEAGYAVDVKQHTYSSDCIPFADKGVPAVSIGRFGARDLSYIHNRHDIIDYICPKSLEKTSNIALTLTRRIESAHVIPFPREMPEDMVKKIDEYLQKDKKEADKPTADKPNN